MALASTGYCDFMDITELEQKPIPCIYTSMKKTLCTLLAALVGLSVGIRGVGAAERVKTEAAPRVEVLFERPEEFTDVKDGALGTDKGREAILADIREFITKKAASLLPAGQSLRITFTNIDLAGEYEPWRTNLRDVRIVKDIYPPRFDFKYQILNSQGAVVKEGTEQVRDLAFMSRLVIDRTDALRFEKSLLEDWMRSSLSPAKK
jgi:hypothetical protein